MSDMSLIGLLAIALILIGAIRVMVWLSFRWLGNDEEEKGKPC